MALADGVSAADDHVAMLRREKTMIAHVSIGVRDVTRSKSFYDVALVSRIRDSFKKSRHVWPEYRSNVARSSGGWHRLSWSR